MELKTPSRVAAFDLGNVTGWALLIDGKILSGYVSLSKTSDSPGMKFLKWRGFLRKMHDACGGWDAVFYERAFQKGGYAAHAWGGYQAILQGFCDETRVPYSSISAAQVKMYATGIGSASKDLVLLRVRERWSPSVVNTNESDALALLYCALDTIEVKAVLPPILANVVDPADELCPTHRRVLVKGVCGECVPIEVVP